MKIALVDDDADEILRIGTYLSSMLADPEIDSFDCGEQFFRVWKAGMYELIVLDIYMPEMTGVDVARRIRECDKDVRIAFATASNEFASESYEVGACWYLRKPISEKEVALMLDRIDTDAIEREKTVVLPDGKSLILRNVVYVSCGSHLITFHTKIGEDTVSRVSFSDVSEILCRYPYFHSPSKGMIVNFWEVENRIDGAFLMSDGSRVPISRRRAKDAINAYATFAFEKLRHKGAL